MLSQLKRSLPKPLLLAIQKKRHPDWFTPPVEEDPDAHPERLVVLPYVRGRTLEVGCGHRKTSPAVIGLDLTPGGRAGSIGNVAGQISQADVAGSGDLLPFAAGTFDAVIARHNLEHYIDTAAVLKEWRRVLRPGGTLAVVLPDEEHYDGRTVELDPTHFHGYSRSALAHLVELVGGYEDVAVGTAVDEWSFFLVAKAS